MQALKAATIIMAILIIAGVAVLATVIVRRVNPSASTLPTTLHQPPGTHLLGIATTSAGLAVALQGGGPDRILILDSTTLRITARIALTP